jgi:hypothetical protein
LVERHVRDVEAVGSNPTSPILNARLRPRGRPCLASREERERGIQSPHRTNAPALEGQTDREDAMPTSTWGDSYRVPRSDLSLLTSHQSLLTAKH